MAPQAPSATTAAAALGPKAAHYHTNLTAALARGRWAEPTPGAAPNGAGLPWSELIRKWGKHTGGNMALVDQIRSVSLLDLSSDHHVRAGVGSSASSGDGASGSASSYVHVQAGAPTAANGSAPGTHSRSPSTAASVAPVASAPHVRSGPSTSTSPRHTDGEDGACCHAWVAGSNWGRTLDGQQADEVRQGAHALGAMLTAGSPLSARDRLSAQLTLAYQHHALGEHAAALTIYDSFDWASPPTSGVVDGDAAVVERIRARTLQGISLEVAHQADARALACYLDAVALLSRLSAAVSPTPAYLLAAGATRPQIPSLIAFREVYRHVSTALTRAAVITARTPDTPQLLRILRTYHALATAWSGSPFRAHQRQRMLSLYLAALQASYPAAGAACPEPYLLGGGVSTKSARATWRAEVSEAVRSGQRMLADTTTFPKSGDVNEAVTEFASQAAAFPALAPSLAPEIINVLWWGTTLTFQSQSILRHLVNLLSAAAGEDKTEARRTFELYVQLVLKARQAADPDATLALRGCEDDARVNDADEALVSERERERAELEMGMDDDEEFTATLLVGAGMLLASFDDSEEAWRYVTLASDVTRHGAVSPKLAAKVDELRGIVRLVMSTSVAGPAKRPEYFAQAVRHLEASTVRDPSSAEAFYHLSHAHATARAVGPAVDAVHLALQLNPQNVRAWHLLALLFTAQGDWAGASRAGETGVALWEVDDEAIAADEADDTGSEAGAAAGSDAHALLLPSGELADPVAAAPRRPSRSSRLETVIQLRMTLNVIAEKLHGPEVALERHQQLFAFFSQRTDGRTSRSNVGSDVDTHSNAPADLGDSYVLPPAADVQVRPPSPTVTGPPSVLTRTISPPAPRTPSSTAGESSTPVSDSDGPERRVTIVYGEKRPPSIAGSKKSLFPKHLHVPSVARARSGMRSATGIAPSTKSASGLSRSASSPSLARGRAASQSTIALSIAPTAVHSHYRGARGAMIAPPPPLKKGAHRSPAEHRILSDLWLMSAASFRRAGKFEQALVAIEEAETHDPENPAVWVQLGQLQLAQDTSPAAAESARTAYTKAMLLKHDYAPAIVCMARLNLLQGDVDLAHSLVWQFTEDAGWDVPEAWMTLGTAVERQGRAARARECLLEALRLEKSRPCRVLGDALRHLPA